jgi:hypothetical protein
MYDRQELYILCLCLCEANRQSCHKLKMSLNRLTNTLLRASRGKRLFGSHGHGQPKQPYDPSNPLGLRAPEPHTTIGKYLLITAFLWFFYQAKENKGAIFGFYKPWLHEHEHTHFHYEKGELGSRPKYVPTEYHYEGLDEEGEDDDEEGGH